MLTELKIPKGVIKIEQDILNERRTGISICQKEGDSLKVDVDQLILIGAALFGSAIPATEFFADIIGKELVIFIYDAEIESLTFEEMLLAMRFNTKSNFNPPKGLDIELVSFTGAYFNISFFSKIIFNYLQVRNQLDRKIQNQIDGYAI